MLWRAPTGLSGDSSIGRLPLKADLESSENTLDTAHLKAVNQLLGLVIVIVLEVGVRRRTRATRFDMTAQRPETLQQLGQIGLAWRWQIEGQADEAHGAELVRYVEENVLREERRSAVYLEAQ